MLDHFDCCNNVERMDSQCFGKVGLIEIDCHVRQLGLKILWVQVRSEHFATHQAQPLCHCSVPSA
jgi:hypothetical protein